MNDLLNELMSPKIMPFVVGIVAVLGGMIVVIVKRLITHRERMALIERGIHPDCPPEDEEAHPPAKQ